MSSLSLSSGLKTCVSEKHHMTPGPSGQMGLWTGSQLDSRDPELVVFQALRLDPSSEDAREKWEGGQKGCCLCFPTGRQCALGDSGSSTPGTFSVDSEFRQNSKVRLSWKVTLGCRGEGTLLIGWAPADQTRSTVWSVARGNPEATVVSTEPACSASETGLEASKRGQLRQMQTAAWLPLDTEANRR